MFKNIVNFNVDLEKSKDALKKIIWQDQCLATELMCKYIPNHVKEMVPTPEGFVLTWDSLDSYNNFLNEPLYYKISDLLAVYGVEIIFSDLKTV